MTAELAPSRIQYGPINDRFLAHIPLPGLSIVPVANLLIAFTRKSSRATNPWFFGDRGRFLVSMVSARVGNDGANSG